MSEEHIDRLLEQMLRETLGGDRPRDLTERVMVQARACDRVRRQWWVGAASAIAASIVLTASLLMFWPQTYPEPVISDGQAVSDTGGQLQHGSRIVTEDDPATLHLGGYVNVTLEPRTAMTLAGGKFEEKVMLDEGNINVAVTKKKGTFDVIVGKAIVHVTGTQFRVGVKEEDTAAGRSKNMVVNVDEGSVVVRPGDGTGPVTLAAGTEKKFQIAFEPIEVGPKPRANAANRAAARAAAGGTPGAGRATLAGNTTTPQPIPAPLPEIGNNFIPPQPPGFDPRLSPLVRPARIMAQNGAVELYGILRQQEGTYLLDPENGDGLILLFAQQTPLEKMPQPGKRVHVAWQNRKVIKVEEMALQ